MQTNNTAQVLLRNRHEDKTSRPGQRSDNAKLWLVALDGGQAGVVSGGAVTALHDYDAYRCFDGAVGVSAGAFACMFLAQGTPAAGTSIYFEDNCQKGEFISYRRLLSVAHGQPTARPPMDLQHLVYHTMRPNQPKELSSEKVKASPVPLYVMMTHAQTGAARAEHIQTSEVAIQKIAHATSCIPVIGGPPVNIEGEYWIDGALADQSAIDVARQQGATHIVLLTNRMPEASVKPVSAIIANTLDYYARQQGIPSLKALLAKRAQVGESMFKEARQNPAVLVLDAPVNVSSFSRDAKKLKKAAIAGYTSVAEALQLKNPQISGESCPDAEMDV